MTCKDCLHVDVCYMAEHYGADLTEDGQEYDCYQFQNKSRFVELPCKIGDTVWALRHFHSCLIPQKSTVSEMYFTRDMKLHITVKYIGRGIWGEKIFPTCEDAEAALRKEEENEAD